MDARKQAEDSGSLTAGGRISDSAPGASVTASRSGATPPGQAGGAAPPLQTLHLHRNRDASLTGSGAGSRIFDRLAAGLFVALVLQLIVGSFLERPVNALGAVGVLQMLAAALYLVRFTRSAWRPVRTRPFRLHLPAVALIVLPSCFTAVTMGRSVLVALVVFVIFFAHFDFLEAFLAGRGGLLSPKGFAALVGAGSVLVVFGRVAAHVARSAAANLPWYNLAPIDGLPMMPFDHLYDLLLVAAFPVVAVAGLAPGASRRRVFALVAAALVAMGIVLSFSRAAWIALGVEAIVLVVACLPRRRVVAAIVTLAAASVMLLFIPGVAQRAASIFSLSYRTNAERLDQWAVAVDLIGRSPFLGYGLGSFGDLFLEAGTGSSIWYWCPHNLFLHIAVECGIPALFVFVAWIADFLRQGPATRAVALSGSGDWRAIVRFGGIVTVCGLLCYGLFDL